MSPTPYRGSLDPFQDIKEQLDAMGVAYCLMIGMVGDPVTSVWSNVGDWGTDGIEAFRTAGNAEWEKQEKNIE